MYKLNRDNKTKKAYLGCIIIESTGFMVELLQALLGLGLGLGPQQVGHQVVRAGRHAPLRHLRQLLVALASQLQRQHHQGTKLRRYFCLQNFTQPC